MTDDELKDLVARLAIAQKETDRQLQETGLQLREIDKQLRELGKQIGGLGEKFGGFTEGLALHSMTKILTEHFGMEVVTPRFKVRKQGQTLELDVLAVVDAPEDLCQEVLASGLYLAGIHEDQFQLEVPENF